MGAASDIAAGDWIADAPHFISEAILAAYAIPRRQRVPTPTPAWATRFLGLPTQARNDPLRTKHRERRHLAECRLSRVCWVSRRGWPPGRR